MNDIAIKVEHLSKQYMIGAKRHRFDSLGELFLHKLQGFIKHAEVPTEEQGTVFQALKDVSFEVKRGEALGIIGRNGSGKSTLLKILSRVTTPTAGRAEVYGRVGSLLEVGTGFHPQLTGRENIYLNGAILGMKKAEIDRSFDEIVEFSEVEKFLDTPVKHYSSGMYTKLAFAVAAHLETEILVVDEVLAVGDMNFQRKCLGKMDDVTKHGRTVLFVSHNLTAVQHLCSHGLVLRDGATVFYGKSGEAIEHYISSVTRHEYGFADLTSHPGRSAGMLPIIRSLGVRNSDGSTRYRDMVTTGEDVVFEVKFNTGNLTVDYAVIGIETSSGERVCTVGTHLCAGFHSTMRGEGVLECRVPHFPLRDGEYNVKVVMGRNSPRQDLDNVEDAIQLRVELGNYFGTGSALLRQQGALAQRSQWRVIS